MTLRIVPTTRTIAHRFVQEHHRHVKRAPPGFKFALAVWDAAARVRGVAIVGRPSSRVLARNALAIEITRVCTDGAPNACSKLYGAARRAARAMGYVAVYTYTLPDEGGGSLRGAGFRVDAERAGQPARKWHNREGRAAEAVGDDLVGGKIRWIG